MKRFGYLRRKPGSQMPSVLSPEHAVTQPALAAPLEEGEAVRVYLSRGLKRVVEGRLAQGTTEVGDAGAFDALVEYLLRIWLERGHR